MDYGPWNVHAINVVWNALILVMNVVQFLALITNMGIYMMNMISFSYYSNLQHLRLIFTKQIRMF